MHEIVHLSVTKQANIELLTVIHTYTLYKTIQLYQHTIQQYNVVFSLTLLVQNVLQLVLINRLTEKPGFLYKFQFLY